jgi:proton glutamate symport protein
VRQLRHWIVLGALALGISLGAWIDQSGGEFAHSIASGIEAIGTLWLNALRMTVGPLVFSMLVVNQHGA